MSITKLRQPKGSGDKMKTIKLYLAVLALFTSMTGWSVDARPHEANRADTTMGVLYFIASDTGLCHCMCEKSKYMGKTLAGIDQTDLSGIRIVKIDFFGNRVLADSLMKAHGLDFVPAFILVDRTGKAYYKISYDFEEKELPALRQGMTKLIQNNRK